MRTTALIDQRPALAGAPWEEVLVSEVMHPGVIVCSPESPLRHAAWLMATHRIHAVVVLADDENGGLWGVVRDVDIVNAAARGELDSVTTGAVAQTPVATISRSDSLVRARALMDEHRVTHLLVTARTRPVGMLSTLDLIAAAAAGVGSRRRT
jgi:CBS domain-containing protein